MLEAAKKELKNKIITEKGKDYYYKLLSERVKKLYDLKKAGDLIFGSNDKQFKEEVIKSTMQKNKDLDDSLQLFEIVMTEIALDVFIKDSRLKRLINI